MLNFSFKILQNEPKLIKILSILSILLLLSIERTKITVVWKQTRGTLELVG